MALKEAEEETGVENFKVLSNGIFSLENITVDPHIKRGKFVSSHIHLNCTFILEADENEQIRIREDENSGVKWIDLDKVIETTTEIKMIPIYSKLIEKIKKEIK